MFRPAWVAVNAATDLAHTCRAYSFPTDTLTPAPAARGQLAAAARRFATTAGSHR